MIAPVHPLFKRTKRKDRVVHLSSAL